MEKEKHFMPNSTASPNVLYDRIFPILGEGHLKVMLYICRRTYGFQKKRDRIAWSQFLKGIEDKDGKVLDIGCGIRSKSTLSNVLRDLEEAGLIVSEKNSKGTFYEINLSADPDEVVRNLYHLKVVRNSYRSGTEFVPKSVRNSYLQNKGKKSKKKSSQPDKKSVDNLITQLVGWDSRQDSPRGYDRKAWEKIIAKYGYGEMIVAMKEHGQDARNAYRNFWDRLTERKA